MYIFTYKHIIYNYTFIHIYSVNRLQREHGGTYRRNMLQQTRGCNKLVEFSNKHENKSHQMKRKSFNENFSGTLREEAKNEESYSNKGKGLLEDSKW